MSESKLSERFAMAIEAKKANQDNHVLTVGFLGFIEDNSDAILAAILAYEAKSDAVKAAVEAETSAGLATMTRHALNRTSPKGGPFIGTCMSCGTPNLTFEDMKNQECPNQRGLTQEDALIEAIVGERINWPVPVPIDEATTLRTKLATAREALGWFLADDRFQVAVGGNPNVVERMLAGARKAYEDTAI